MKNLSDHTSETFGARPFLRWAGGKSRLVKFLKSHILPSFSENKRYYEPFLGAGSLFFALKPQKATLSDHNKDLIDCYLAIKKRPDLIASHLKKLSSDISEDYYYRMRKKYNESPSSFNKSALFIFLNKTCFNGIWRVNRNGKFNVPYGHRENPSFPSKSTLETISKSLSNVSLHHKNYTVASRYPRKGDFVYFDPPYPPLNGTSYFTQYTKEGFNLDNHLELAKIVRKLDKRGCSLMISNADLDSIRKMYKGFRLHPLEVTRLISANGKRHKVGELIITNYDIE